MEAKLIKTIDEQGVMYSLSGDNLPENYVLSLKNCQAIANGYDLDDIIQNNTNEYITTNIRKFNYGFKKGFQKALEILGDKKFSEKDMRKAFDTNHLSSEHKESQWVSFIQSLQQTEWSVSCNPDVKDADGNLILKRK
jgi:hypothetical protein